MRSLSLAAACVLMLGLSAYWSAEPENGDMRIRLRLIDAETGKGLGGMVRVFAGRGEKPLPLPGLLDRLQGLERSTKVRGWHVVPAEGAETTLPRTGLRVEAVSGLETALATQVIDLAKDTPKEVSVRLPVLFRPDKLGLAAGNTHLHLRNLTRQEADNYLRQIPAADGLKVLYISYLERHKDDESYVTNRYPVGDLKQFDGTGVLINNGEEHRHNFEGFGQGYGHVMLLGIQRLVKPVSIGRGIMGTGPDEPSLSVGIGDARKQRGTVVWCHNAYGFEDVPNALAGRLDALNVFDGSRTGSFEDTYYRFLNVGLRLPISTGTDWFMYDFSRVYVKPKAPLTVRSWLDALKAGTSVATNGPLLTLTVDDQPIGENLRLEKPKKVRIEATGIGRHDFQQLQLVHNGKVVQTEPCKKSGAGFAARLVRETVVDTPGWFAARIDSQTRNEFDLVLYAHTSPVYVEVGGKRIFDAEAARALLRQLEEGRAEIARRGQFSGPDQKEKIVAFYDRAARELTGRIQRREP